MLKRYDHIPTAMRRHSIEPTVFVLANDESGKTNIMAAGWNVKCSYEPPMMAVALSKDGYTHNLVRKTGQFVLAVPSPEQSDLLQYVGSVSGATVDKFKERSIPTQPAEEVAVPLLSEARVNFECVVADVVTTGDHFLCIGSIVAAHYNVDKDQLYFAGRDSSDQKVFQELHTSFPEDVN